MTSGGAGEIRANCGSYAGYSDPSVSDEYSVGDAGIARAVEDGYGYSGMICIY